MSFQIGEKVSFTYLKDIERNSGRNGRTADYAKNAANYSGEVVEVRNIEQQPLSNTTVNYGRIKGERSENLVTVELEDGLAQAFYDGRMVNVTKQEMSS